MNPWLLYTEPLRLPTYFTLLMIGFSVGTFALRREALRDGDAPRETFDAALWAVFGALFGARAAEVLLVAPAFYWANPWRALSPQAGWVFYGGLAGGALTVAAFARSRGVSAWRLIDRFAVATPLGLVFGRLGCLGAGCCHGRVADWPLGEAIPWAVRYTRRGRVPEELLAVPLHPAPLYAIALALSVFVALSWLRGRQRFEGEVTLALLTFYGLGRSAVEVFRGDVSRGLYAGGLLSTSQAIGLSTAALAAVVWWRRSAR